MLTLILVLVSVISALAYYSKGIFVWVVKSIPGKVLLIPSVNREIMSVKWGKKYLCHMKTWKSSASLHVTAWNSVTNSFTQVETGYCAGYHFGLDITPRMMGHDFFRVYLDGKVQGERVEKDVTLLEYLNSVSYSLPLHRNRKHNTPAVLEDDSEKQE